MKKNNINLSAIGETMIELSLFAKNKANISFAGDTLNALIYFKFLTQKLDFDVNFITRFGGDNITSDIIKTIESYGVVIKQAPREHTRNTGIHVIELDENNDRNFRYWRKGSPASEFLSPPYFEQEKEAVLSASHIYLSGITVAILSEERRNLLLEILDSAKELKKVIIFDLNYRSILWSDDNTYWYDKFLKRADIIFGSEDDLLSLDIDFSIYKIKEQVLRLGDLVTKVTLWDDDFTKKTVITENHKPLEEVIDTTAAGDAFSGGYLAKRFTGSSVQESLVYAHDVASVVIGHRGAMAPKEVLAKFILPSS